MKNIFRLFCMAALAVFVVACSDEDRFHNFKMDRVNLNGANYLALAGGQNNTKVDSSSRQYLYSVDENGNLSVVAYEYQCDDDGVATELSRKLTLTINQMVPVGDKYIWLVGCRYECDDYSGFSESMQDAIRDMVNHSKQNFGENFLIRKSDGKIFDLNEVIVKFPITSVNVPGLGSVGMVGYGGGNGLPVDGDLTGDRLRKLGLINQLGDDIYLASGSYYGGLTRLHDNGSTISVYNVLNYNIGYSVTDNQGHLGTTICYNGNSPNVASIMAPDGTLSAIHGIPSNDYRPEMRCIGGKFFVSAEIEIWEGNEYIMTTDSIYLVDVSTSPATATAVAVGYFSPNQYATVYVSDEENYSWFSGTTLFTFNSNTYQLTESTLPAGWPQYSMFDAEGYCYEPHINVGLQSFTIYNLAIQQTEEVTCDRSQVPAFNFEAGCNYDGGLGAFIESVIMADGSTTTLITDVKGPQRGITRVGGQTESNNNIEVSTLIPLN